MTLEAVEVDAAKTTDQVRQRVECTLAGFLNEHAAPISDPAVAEGYRHLREFVLSGGKRVRPVLCYWGWRGAGGRDSDLIISAGAALELCHAGLLIHDDIMDGSLLRRGHPTLHRRLDRPGRMGAEPFGRSAAILLGVLALAWADELLVTSGADPGRLRAAYRSFAAMRTEVISGQYLDIIAQVSDGADLDQALTVVRYKTAKYTVERPLQIGGALAGADPALLASYSAFGLPLGEAFQLRDDVLGVFGDPAVTGKSAMDDLREGKHTVLIAQAHAAASAAQRRLLLRWHGNPELDDPHAADLRQVIRDTGALDHVESLIDRRAGEALAELRECAIEPSAREALTLIAHQLTFRER